MNSSSLVYTNLQDLIVSEQINRDKSLKVMSFILKLESPQTYGTPSIYMMTRPRGFGLSLLTSATDKIIRREKDIVGKIEDEELLKELPCRHTVCLDFKNFKAKTTKDFKRGLIDVLQELFWFHHIESHFDTYMTPKVYFTRLLESLYKRHQESMAIIIDNYDKPLMVAAMMADKEKATDATCTYLDMLNVIRHTDKAVRWCLLTGHTKFALASEYSEGLPLVEDLSSDPSFESMFGFTKEEVKIVFKNQIDKFAKAKEMTAETYLNILDKCYGGFCFSDNLVKVMCPASISHLMQNQGLLYPYSASGNYTFLKYALKHKNNDLSWLYGKDGQDPLFISSVDKSLEGKQLGSLLIQLGFATSSKVLVNNDEGYTTWRYRFDFPNLDMRKTFDIITGKCDQEEANIPLSFEQAESIGENE